MKPKPKIIRTSNKECDGIFFKCIKNNHYNEKTKSFEHKITYRFMNKVSCSGCDLCNAFFLDCKEGFDCGIIRMPEYPIDDRIYKVILKTLGYEIKYCEDWEWELKTYDKEIIYG